MQAFVDLIAVLLLIAAALTFVSGSLNALLGWNLGLRIGGSSIPLPEDFVSVAAIAIALIILSGFFFVVADFKRAGRFIKKYKLFVLSGLTVTVAISAIAVAQFAPNLALELAVQEGNSAKAQSLLEKRDYPVEVLNDLTYWSLINEDYEVTETMFEQGADINHRRGEFKTTLLHNAMLYFPATATDFLLEKQIDMDAQDDLGRTAFHHLLAYRENNIEGATEADILAIAEKLITAGADPNITDQNDQTALTLAETKGYDSIVQLLQQNDANFGAQ